MLRDLIPTITLGALKLKKKPGDAEIASAPTLEAYFNLKKPRLKMHSLNSYFFFEYNFPSAFEFLGQAIPRNSHRLRPIFEIMRLFDAAGVTDTSSFFVKLLFF